MLRLWLQSFRVGAIFIALNLLVALGTAQSSSEERLTILHTSEHHGTAQPIEERGQPKVAGMAARATLIEQIRREAASVLLVDSGDILLGTALSSFFRGEPDIKAMNLMGYQAMAAGNHDFDYGLDHLQRLQDLASFPILCSNLLGRNVTLPCRSSAVVHVGTLTVGIIGLLGRSNFPDTFNRDVVKLLDLRDPVETARTMARELKALQGADLVVAITHQTTDEDLALLAQAPGLDAVIGGHTGGFDGLRTASTDGPVAHRERPGPVFVKTHRQGRTVGRLDLQIARRVPDGHAKEPASVTSADATNLPVAEPLPPQPAVQALIDEFAQKLEREASTVIGRSLVTLNGENAQIRSQETNLGNFLSDMLREEFGTEIALVNSGQIRDSIPPGPVDIKRVLRVLPFNSPAVTFSITGEQLLMALENSVSRLPQPAGRFLQVAGLTVGYDLSAPPQKRVRHVAIGTRPLEPTRRYTVATDGFLADGGDGFTMFAAATDRIDRQTPLRDLLIRTLQAGPLKASLDGRIRIVESSATELPRPEAGSGMQH